MNFPHLRDHLRARSAEQPTGTVRTVDLAQGLLIEIEHPTAAAGAA